MPKWTDEDLGIYRNKAGEIVELDTVIWGDPTKPKPRGVLTREQCVSEPAASRRGLMAEA